MGKILDREMPRDAVHIAVVPVIAAESMHPATHCGLLGDGRAGTRTKLIGIVDPYLSQAVAVGERFFLFLYPGSITSLKHQWTHPDLDPIYDGGEYTQARDKARAIKQKAMSEQWMREFVRTHDCPDYEEVIGKAAAAIRGGNDAWDAEYLHFNGTDAHGKIPEEFWDHVENIVGEKAKGTKPKYFSCSC